MTGTGPTDWGAILARARRSHTRIYQDLGAAFDPRRLAEALAEAENLHRAATRVCAPLAGLIDALAAPLPPEPIPGVALDDAQAALDALAAITPYTLHQRPPDGELWLRARLAAARCVAPLAPAVAQAIDALSQWYREGGRPRTALAYAQAALQRWSDLGDARAAARSQATVGQDLGILGQVAEGRAALHTALAALDGAGDRVGAASVRRRLANDYLLQGELPAAIAAYQDALEALADAGDAWGLQERSSAHYGLGAAHQHLGDLTAAEADARTTIALAEAGGALDDAGAGRLLLAQLLDQSGDPDQAHALISQVADDAGRRRSLILERTARRLLAALDAEQLRLQPAMEQLTTARAIGDASESRWQIVLEEQFAGGLLSQIGDAVQAYEAAQRTIDGLALNGNRVGLPAAYADLGNRIYQLGDLDRAERAYQQGLREAQTMGLIEVEIRILRELADIATLRGKRDQALDLLHESIALAKHHGFTWLLPWGYLAIARTTEEPDDALEAITAGLAHAGGSARARFELQLTAVRTLAQHGRADAAEQAARRLLADAREQRAPLYIEQAREQLVRLLVEEGQTEAAVDLALPEPEGGQRPLRRSLAMAYARTLAAAGCYDRAAAQLATALAEAPSPLEHMNLQIRIAELAILRGAAPDALQACDAALTHFRQVADPAYRAMLVGAAQSLATIFQALGVTHRAVALLRNARELAATAGGPLVRARVEAQLAIAYMLAGESAMAQQHRDAALAERALEHAPLLKSEILYLAGTLYASQRSWDQSRDALEQALALLPASGMRRRRAEILSRLAMTHRLAGQPAQAVAVARAALAEAEASHDHDAVGAALIIMAQSSLDQGDRAAALAYAERLTDGSAGQPSVERQLDALALIALAQAGGRAAPLEQLDQLAQAGDRLIRRPSALVLTLMAILASRTSDPLGLLGVLDRLREAARRAGEPRAEVSILRVTGQVYTARRRWRDAERAASEALTIHRTIALQRDLLGDPYSQVHREQWHLKIAALGVQGKTALVIRVLIVRVLDGVRPRLELTDGRPPVGWRRRLQPMVDWHDQERLRLALHLSPDDPTTYAARAIWMARRGRRAETEADLATALALLPQEPAIHRAKVDALTLLGDIPAARAALDNLIAIVPDSPQLYRLRADYHARLGDAAAAEADRAEAMRLMPPAPP